MSAAWASEENLSSAQRAPPLLSSPLPIQRQDTPPPNLPPSHHPYLTGPSPQPEKREAAPSTAPSAAWAACALTGPGGCPPPAASHAAGAPAALACCPCPAWLPPPQPRCRRPALAGSAWDAGHRPACAPARKHMCVCEHSLLKLPDEHSEADSMQLMQHVDAHPACCCTPTPVDRSTCSWFHHNKATQA